MAASRRAWPVLITLVLGIVLCIFTIPASAGSNSPPSSKAELICHTSNPDECYPKLFQPTDEFQTVHEDQELPPGLHVRLNIWSGKKEAKINVPGEDDPALEGLPVDSAVVLVEPEQLDEPHIPKGAPEYESVGKVKEPQQDGKSFLEAFKMVKGGDVQSPDAFDKALAELEDISHDIYYGLKITEDVELLKGLFCLMGDKNAPVVEGVTPRDQQAAAILAGALQNNPTALKEVDKVWTTLMATPCSKDGALIRRGFYTNFVPSTTPESPDAAKAAASRVKAKVSAINGLIKSDTIRADFLKNDGLRLLLEVLVPEGKEWAVAQRKVGQLVIDTFLDENMGAKLGQWPKAAKVSDQQCQSAESRTRDGCWEYHVAKILKANKGDKDHWSRDLHDRLSALKKEAGAPSGHSEL